MVQGDIFGTIDPIRLKFVLLSELWPGMATKKIQLDRLNSSGDIALDHNGTCGLERRYIWTRTPKDFPPLNYRKKWYCALKGKKSTIHRKTAEKKEGGSAATPQ